MNLRMTANATIGLRCALPGAEMLRVSTYRFKSSVHDANLLLGELGLTAQVLESDRNGFRHACVF